MIALDAGEVARRLEFPRLISALAEAFAAGAVEAPLRHHHSVPTPDGGAPGTLLLMPAWRRGARLGVKLVTVFPDNAARGLPAVAGLYLLVSAVTGLPEAILDGGALTARRTAAASALAASMLARADAARLLMVGTGALAPHLIAAQAAVRPLRSVAIWGRSPAKAAALAAQVSAAGLPAEAVEDLGDAVAAADIVSCATLTETPLIAGARLPPGAHLDLVGGFTPKMREADDDCVRRARLYCDTRAGALTEAGDLVDPIARGVIRADDIVADLPDLCRDPTLGRRSDDEITLFKSVGAALEDLVAAELAVGLAAAEAG